jgi:hypothetical protein
MYGMDASLLTNCVAIAFRHSRSDISGTNADDNKLTIQDLYRAANSKMTGMFPCLLPVAK